MRTYSFDCLNSEGTVVRVHLRRCHSDAEALAEGETMIDEPSCFSVQVWGEKGLVGRLGHARVA